MSATGFDVNTLFVMDPIDRIDVSGDSTYMLMLEGCRRDRGVYWCTPGDLFAVGGRCHARCQKTRVSLDAPYFDSSSPAEVDLEFFDVVWLRKDPPFDIGYIFSTYMLDLVPSSTMVINPPASIRDANEKMVALRFPDLVPSTLVTREVSRAMAWIADAPGRVVLKPWDGNGGRGVLVSEHGDGNLRSMLEVLTENQTVHILVQHHIPEIAQGDKRIILIDGDPVGWMNRVPQPGDHRGNMHVGATVEGCSLSETDKIICGRIGDWLKEAGLLFVGIDTIGPFMTEINVTSPTGIREINRLMGTQLERVLTDAVDARLQAHRQGEVP
jgi:glutathione synthase